MNLVEFKSEIVRKAQAGNSTDAEIPLLTIFNVVNSRPVFNSAGFSRIKTASKSNYHAKGEYYLVNLACTTPVRKQFAMKLIVELATSLGFTAKGKTEEQILADFKDIILSGDDAKYARELMNATQAVAITRKSDFLNGQFVDAAYEMHHSTATGMQELRFTALVPVVAETAKVQKSSLGSIFGSLEEDDTIVPNQAADPALDAILNG